MDEARTLRFFRGKGAIVDGHFVLDSGKHAAVYVNKDEVTPHAEAISRLGLTIAERVAGYGVETVIGPAEGSVILAHCVAYHLGRLEHRDIQGVWASKTGYDCDGKGIFSIRPSFVKWVMNTRVLAVEDIMTTGSSVARTIEKVRGYDGTVVGAVALWNRGGVIASDIGLRESEFLIALSSHRFDAWGAEDCPLCRKGVPINIDLGRGREYLERQRSRT
ncbi:MAG: phosphoribosyltransferase family protein [Patescibacteria group bacterium]